MTAQKVTAKVTKPAEGVSPDPVTVEYDFGDDLKALVDKFSEEVVYSRAKASLIIDLQAAIRRAIQAKRSKKEIQQMVSEWVPGVKQPAKSPADRLKDMLAGKTKEEKLAILKEAGLL